MAFSGILLQQVWANLPLQVLLLSFKVKQVISFISSSLEPASSNDALRAELAPSGAATEPPARSRSRQVRKYRRASPRAAARFSELFLKAQCGPSSLLSNSVVVVVVQSLSRVQLLGPHGLLCPWDSLGKNTGVCGHFLLQHSIKSPSA